MDTMSVSGGGCDPIALRLVQSQAVIGIVHHRASVECQGGLAIPDQRLALHHGQRGGVRLGRMEGGAGRVSSGPPSAAMTLRSKSQISGREALISENDQPSGLTRNRPSRPSTL